jgi:O-acetyl-ADP-ribose deacetylase (regulator of RNase III)
MSSGNVKHLSGNLLTAQETYIVHQCNCVTTTGKGLAQHIFNQFPDANVYRNSTQLRKPGNIEIRGKVVAMYAQNKPGKVSTQETSQQRHIWFQQCLQKLGDIMLKEHVTDVAFPYGIGCGLAGGNWSIYSRMIQDFAEEYNLQVSIYHL